MVAAVVVDGHAVGWDINHAQIKVGGNRRPGGNVPGVLPGVVRPGFMAIFAGLRNDVELPQELAAAGVIAKDVAGHVLDAGLVITLFRRVAHHDHAVHYDGWRR